MVTKADRRAEEMVDYLGPFLPFFNHHVGEMTVRNKKKTIHALTSDNGLLLLVNQSFTEDEFDALASAASRKSPNWNAVFYKDGQTFFRSHYNPQTGLLQLSGKQDHRSLKNYDREDLKRIITFSKPERHMQDIRPEINYYQPESDRLEQSLLCYDFDPVYFDYSHITYGQFRPENKDSKQYFIWGNKRVVEKPLDVSLRRLEQRREPGDQLELL